MSTINHLIKLDKQDRHLLSDHRFHDDGRGYPITNIRLQDGRRVSKRLHTLIFPTKKGLYVDHINRVKTDNCRSNLRYVTPTQSAHNTPIAKDNTSGHKGIYWQKTARKWHAQIMLRGKQIYLGLYARKEDAVNAYREASRNLHGVFAGELTKSIL